MAISQHIKNGNLWSLNIGTAALIIMIMRRKMEGRPLPMFLNPCAFELFVSIFSHLKLVSIRLMNKVFAYRLTPIH